MIKKELLNSSAIEITLNRLACELKENHGDFKDSVLIAIQPRGLRVMERLKSYLVNLGVQNVKSGALDVTFFRDDFRRREAPLRANQTHIDVILENKKVVFIDDVLYTGRSIRSALDAVQSFGRPAEIELLVLIDRRFSRHLPIQPDYTGKQVDSLDSQKVLVEWKEEHGKDAVFLIKPEDE